MAKATVTALIVAVLVGVGADAMWGRSVGIGVGVLAGVITAVAAALRRNRRDLDEMRRAQVAEEVKSVLGEEDE